VVEVVWKDKFDSSGAKTAPPKIALPLQTIETVNESTQERQKSLERFVSGRQDFEWRNRLIWGDKKYVLPSLLPEFAGKINLIYVDPPFATGANFSFTAKIAEDPDDGDDSEYFTKQPSVIEQKAYRDTWGQGLDSYLRWVYDSATVLHELLSEEGSLYVHVGTNVSHYVKAVIDEVFERGFVNQIVWKRQSAKSGAFEGMGQYGRIHEVILFYTKSDSWTWNQQYVPYDSTYLEAFYKYVDRSTGKRYRLSDLTAAGSRKGESGGAILVNGDKVYPAPGRHWALGLQKDESVQGAMDRLIKAGRIWYEQGKMPAYKRYLDEMPGLSLQDVWTDIRPVAPQSEERLNYETQKPEALLARIISSSSRERDLVLDCFVGSGTTAAVAEKLGRRWIACDLSRFAIQTTRKRLLRIQGVRPFVIQNLGKYERQAWQTAEFGKEATSRVRAYIDFIVQLYRAQRLNGHVWLHGKRGNRFIHVGSVDSPVSPLDVGQIVAEFKRLIGTGEKAPKSNGIDILGWDFAFELNELAKQQAAQANVDLRFLRIPSEVLDKKAVEQGDIRFFELASLNVGLRTSGKKVTVSLKDFTIPLDDVPSDVQKGVTHWSQWVDYWAIDWDNKNDTFHNEWQEYRTRDKPKLETESSKVYEEHGRYRIVVKVIDILGNDTTKVLSVNA
jgi:DNA modification methylase